MANLVKVVNNDLKQALRQRQALEISVVRLLLAALNYKKIALGKNIKGDLTGEQATLVVKSEIRKRKDSISAYQQGGRQDLADRERKEIEILQKYLPPALSDDEIKKMVKEVIKSIGEVSMKNFGQVMGQVMAKVKNKADGNKVSEIVKKILAG